MYLNIHIRSAELHRDVELIGQMAPYVVVTDSYGVEFKRTSVSNGKNPVWSNEHFKISAKIPALVFQLFDYERIKGKDDFIGRGEAKTQGWASQLNVPFPVKVPLYWEGQAIGSLDITMTLQPKAGKYDPNVHVPEFAKLQSFKKQSSIRQGNLPYQQSPFFRR